MRRGTVDVIKSGSCYMGFEFGSTRIKASLIAQDGASLAAGSQGWENRFDNGVWTYGLDEVWAGAAACFADLKGNVRSRFGTELTHLAAGGFSAMMHGYLAFDTDGNLLVPFRTWRNTITGPAATELTELFQFAIPQRWSIAHLHQAILNGEFHVKDIAFITTLAGYVHWQLTGEKVLGVDDASGMFPIDPRTGGFDARMLEAYDRRVADYGFPWKTKEILPRVLKAGEMAGTLTAEGAKLLDPSGSLAPGVPLCPPEGDAGTGMIATNAIRPRTGNVSVGTSVFAMVVLDAPLRGVHEEIDIVATPEGKPVAMAHSNNGTSDLDAWMSLLGEAVRALGRNQGGDELYARLLPLALEAEPDAGGVLSIGYVSGEHITGFTEGRPLVVRAPDGSFTLANLLRSHLFGLFCALRTGLDILTGEEGVVVEGLKGHGGIFRTPEVGQRMLAAATGVPVSVSSSAGEGGAWGMALLAAYLGRRKEFSNLQEFLDAVMAGQDDAAITPSAADVEGFARYFERYHAGLAVERAAVKAL
jgi:sugar (pentulose or hexulose) kinase